MKRVIPVVLVIALLTTACGRPEGISDIMYDYGLAALETADDYLSGKITIKDAHTMISQTKIKADAYPMPVDEYGVPAMGDNNVSFNIYLVEYSVRSKLQGMGTDKQIKEKRNELAKSLGK